MEWLFSWKVTVALLALGITSAFLRVNQLIRVPYWIALMPLYVMAALVLLGALFSVMGGLNMVPLGD